MTGSYITNRRLLTICRAYNDFVYLINKYVDLDEGDPSVQWEAGSGVQLPVSLSNIAPGASVEPLAEATQIDKPQPNISVAKTDSNALVK